MMTKKGPIVAWLLFLCLVRPSATFAISGQIFLGGSWTNETNLSFHVINPNVFGVITIDNIEFFNPDGTQAALKSPFPLPQVLNPYEVRAYSMDNFFFSFVPPQQPWHPETYTMIIHWQGNVANDLIAVSQTAWYDATGNLITIVKNQFGNKSIGNQPVPPCATPGIPSSPSPPNEATGASVNATLTWATPSNTSSYDVYFGTSSNPPYVGNTTGTSYLRSSLSYSTTYSWPVVAKHDCGNSTSGSVWSFTTVAAPCATPGTPSNPSPANGATGISTSPTLGWSAISNTDSYDVYFGTSSNPPYAGNTTGTSYLRSSLSYSTTYYWKVVAKNDCGSSTAGSVWSFSTGINPNAPIISVAPTSYDYGSVKMKWNKSASFTVANSGKTNLTISTSIKGTDASMFRISGGGIKTIKPGRSLTMRVSFKPASTGKKSATLEIASNDPVAPTVDIPLSGTGQ
jgi:hypothetical protein